MVKVYMQQRRFGPVDALPERLLHPLEVIEVLRPPKIDNEVGTGKDDTISLDKMILGSVVGEKIVVFGPRTCSGGLCKRMNDVATDKSFFSHPFAPSFSVFSDGL
jgi:hypothetical protein